jgi:hypothetical protein
MFQHAIVYVRCDAWLISTDYVSALHHAPQVSANGVVRFRFSIAAVLENGSADEVVDGLVTGTVADLIRRRDTHTAASKSEGAGLNLCCVDCGATLLKSVYFLFRTSTGHQAFAVRWANCQSKTVPMTFKYA